MKRALGCATDGDSSVDERDGPPTMRAA
jgi:hypothetical protein